MCIETQVWLMLKTNCHWVILAMSFSVTQNPPRHFKGSLINMLLVLQTLVSKIKLKSLRQFIYMIFKILNKNHIT